MSDRLAASNGKRYRAWGTRELCPGCGGCLCYGCHPEGPCVTDDRATGSALLLKGIEAAGPRPEVPGVWSLQTS